MHARDAWHSRWLPQAIRHAELRISVVPRPGLPVTRHLCREYGIAMRYVWMARAALPQLLGGSCKIGICMVGELACIVDVGCADATGCGFMFMDGGIVRENTLGQWPGFSRS